MADFANSPDAAAPTGSGTESGSASGDQNVSSRPESNADTQASAPPSSDSPASPSDAPKPKTDRQALLDIARAVVTPPAKSSESEAAASSDQKSPPTPDPLEADPSADELSALVPRTKARIEKLLSQRNEARTELAQLKPAADKWAQMDRYLTQHDLAPEDVNLLLGIGAALRRGDFKAFYEGVRPYVALAEQHLGMVLPPELQAKVDGGEISLAAATELSQARLSNARLQQSIQANTEQQRAQREAEAVAARDRVLVAAVTEWERGVQARDADYLQKAEMIAYVGKAIAATEGWPTTPEAAIALAQRAYDEVNKKQRLWRAPPQPTRPTPSGVQSVNGVARTEPRSMLEAAWRALEQPRYQ